MLGALPGAGAEAVRGERVPLRLPLHPVVAFAEASFVGGCELLLVHSGLVVARFKVNIFLVTLTI